RDADWKRGIRRARGCLPGSADHELLGRTGDRQEACVVGLMTTATAQDEVQRVVTAAVGAMDDVVQLEPSCGAAAIDAAAAAVAAPHEARDARRNILIRPLGRRTVDRSDVLRVAHRAVDRRWPDRDPRASALLPALPAALAHGDGDLELRAAGRLGR